jgi:hypothetical protein
MAAYLSSEPAGPSVVAELMEPADDRGLDIVPGLVWAFLIHDDGSAEPLALDKPIERRRDGWPWLHFNLADARAVEWLRAAELPARALAMMLSRDRHQQLHANEDCIYGIFADFMTRIEGPGDEIGHLRFIMTERLLVSGRHHALCSVEWTRETIERGGRRLPHVAALLDLIVEHVGDAIDQLADKLATDLDRDREQPDARQTQRGAAEAYAGAPGGCQTASPAGWIAHTVSPARARGHGRFKAAAAAICRSAGAAP